MTLFHITSSCLCSCGIDKDNEPLLAWVPTNLFHLLLFHQPLNTCLFILATFNLAYFRDISNLTEIICRLRSTSRHVSIHFIHDQTIKTFSFLFWPGHNLWHHNPTNLFFLLFWNIIRNFHMSTNVHYYFLYHSKLLIPKRNIHEFALLKFILNIEFSFALALNIFPELNEHC